MKRNILLLLNIVMACLLQASCAHAEPANAGGDSNGKTLVVYYSYTGNCRDIVNIITGQLTADVLEVLPAEEGVKYDANNYAIGSALISAIRNNPDDPDSYPAIKPVTTALSDYQNIIIVSPLWWSQMAAPLQTYLFNYGGQMAGKNVALVVSSHSSGISSVVADAHRLVPDGNFTGDPLWINNSNRSSTATLVHDWLETLQFNSPAMTTSKLYITIDGVTMTASLADNSSAQALMAALRNAPITYEAHDYGNFEKVGPLGQSFPQNNESITTQPGDLILYQGNDLCIYYDNNTWSFTRIGKIDNATQQAVKDFVKAGQGNVTVTLSVDVPTGVNGIGEVTAAAARHEAYTLAGRRAMSGEKGIIIQDGKKVFKQ